MDKRTIYTTTLTLDMEQWDTVWVLMSTNMSNKEELYQILETIHEMGLWSIQTEVGDLSLIEALSGSDDDSKERRKTLLNGGAVLLGNMEVLSLYTPKDFGDSAIAQVVNAMLLEYRKSIEVYASVGKNLVDKFRDLLERSDEIALIKVKPSGTESTQGVDMEEGSTIISPGSSTLQ